MILLAADGGSWLVVPACPWNSMTMTGVYIHVLLGSRDARNVNRNDRNANSSRSRDMKARTGYRASLLSESSVYASMDS